MRTISITLFVIYILLGSNNIAGSYKYSDPDYASLANTNIKHLSEIRSILDDDVKDKDLIAWGTGNSFAIVICDSVLTTFVAELYDNSWSVKEFNVSDKLLLILEEEQLVNDLKKFLSDKAYFYEPSPNFISGDIGNFGEGVFWFCVDHSDGTHSNFFTHTIPDFNYIYKPLWLYLMKIFLLQDQLNFRNLFPEGEIKL